MRLLVGAVLVVAGSGIGWAATTVFAPPPDIVDATPFTTATVVKGEVSSSFSVNTVAEWEPVLAATNLASGTVTSVSVEQGAEIAAGAVLYSVNLRPTVAAQGGTPAFRSMSVGDRGADITQLQSMLASLGFYRGTVDGGFGRVTATAVRAWQKSLGVDATGSVQLGDVVFIADLPARVSLDVKVINRGASVSGGEAAIFALTASPTFRIPATSAQAAKMPTGTSVDIVGPNQKAWVAVVVEQRPQEQGDDIDVVLGGVDGASICGEDCGQIEVGRQAVLPAKVVTLETVTGLVVPSAALVSKPDGTIVVSDDQGAEHEVDVVASADGMSVVRGVEVGLSVRVPAAGE